jgi:hypothetical protein
VLARHLRYVERTSRRLARATFMAMARHQAALERKQALLGRIVDIGAELYAISAACSRAALLDGAASGDAATDLADLFCVSARQRIGRLFHELRHKADRLHYRRAQQVLDDRFVWLEEGILDLYARGPLVGTPPDGAAKESERQDLAGPRSA